MRGRPQTGSASYAAEQAQEPITGAGTASTTLPVIIAGGLNSGPGTTTGACNVIAGALTDTWPAAKPNDPGLTWALHGEDFNPYHSAPGRRIVLEQGLQPHTDVPAGTTDLTPSGLCPSDHAGVVGGAQAGRRLMTAAAPVLRRAPRGPPPGQRHAGDAAC